MSCGGGGDHRPAHSVKSVAGWIKITGSIIGVYFSIVCDLRPWRAPQNQSHFAHFALFFVCGSHSLSFSCLIIFVQETSMLNRYLTFFWVRIGRFCIEDFDLVAIWCVCKCSIFVYCKRYRSIVWQCLSYLIYIDKQP